jgi:hypothetical protein
LGFFFEHRCVAKSSQGCVPRLFRVHTGGDILGNLLIKMKLNFIIQSLSDVLTMEQRLQPQPESFGPHYDTPPLRLLHYQVYSNR